MPPESGFTIGDAFRAELYSMVRWWRGVRRGGSEQTPSNPGRPIPLDCDTRPFTTASEAVPAYAIFCDDGAAFSAPYPIIPTIKAKKTASVIDRPFYVNAGQSQAVGASQPGWCRQVAVAPLEVAFEASDGTPSAGDVWGPVAGSWKLRSSGTGFRALLDGDSDKGTVWVAVTGGSEQPQLVEFAATTDFSYGDTIDATIVDWWPDGSDDPDPQSQGVSVVNTIFYGDEDSIGLAMVMRDGTLVAVNVDCQEEVQS